MRQIFKCPYLLYGYGESSRNIHGAGMAGFVFYILIISIATVVNNFERFSKNTLVLTTIPVVVVVMFMSSSSFVENRIEKIHQISARRKIVYDVCWLAIFIFSMVFFIRNCI